MGGTSNHPLYPSTLCPVVYFGLVLCTIPGTPLPFFFSMSFGGSSRCRRAVFIHAPRLLHPQWALWDTPLHKSYIRIIHSLGILPLLTVTDTRSVYKVWAVPGHCRDWPIPIVKRLVCDAVNISTSAAVWVLDCCSSQLSPCSSPTQLGSRVKPSRPRVHVDTAREIGLSIQTGSSIARLRQSTNFWSSVGFRAADPVESLS